MSTRCLLWVVGCCCALFAQEPAEVSSHESPPSFNARTNLVLVRVVVRDRQGNAVGGLHKEDFQLFDRGKPQTISSFNLETSTHAVAGKADNPIASDTGIPAPAMPERYLAYLFDDIHLNVSDLMTVRQAALHHLDTLVATDRAAIFSTSGQTMADFTDDRVKLRDALLHLTPRPLDVKSALDCPDLSYYMADLIENKNDSQALNIATAETMSCGQVSDQTTAQSLAHAAARRVLTMGDQETHISLGVLKDVVRRMAAMPGQRMIVLISPGFLVPQARQDETELIDRAIRSNVLIHALDARGLYTDAALVDASKPVSSASAASAKLQYDRAGAMSQEDLLAELADGTGGTFFGHSNDLQGGLHRLATAPAFYYVLGFSPQGLKLDGSYHALKVKLVSDKQLSLQARRGYYAPKHLEDATESAKQEIEEALFSLDEMHDIPVELHTQFFKSTDVDAKLTVVAHVDLKNLHFRKADGRNVDNLTVVSGLFDRNGNYLKAEQKLVDMKLRDETLAKGRGLTLKTSFDVKPGNYMVRLVVRDVEGQQIGALSGAVEIP